MSKEGKILILEQREIVVNKNQTLVKYESNRTTSNNIKNVAESITGRGAYEVRVNRIDEEKLLWTSYWENCKFPKELFPVQWESN